MPRRPRSLALAALALVVLIAGCGSGGAVGQGASAPSEPAPPALPSLPVEALTSWTEGSDTVYGTVHYRMVQVGESCLLETQESFKGSVTHVVVPCPPA